MRLLIFSLYIGITMKRIYQIFLIALISATVGFGANTVRNDPLPVRDPGNIEKKADTAQEDPLRIPLREAERLYKEEAALFIDARPESAYQAGHIKGAVNLPWQKAEEQFYEVVENVPADKPIITYCDGESCELSDFLASFLQDIGYENAKALHDGWGRWKEKGLPQAYPES